MKKLLPLLMLLSILSSCVTLDRARDTQYWIADFRPYIEKDFLFTPHVYTGDHVILASVSVVIIPATKTKKTSEDLDDIYVRISEMSSLYREDISPKEALETLYEYAVGLGANGISELKYDKDALIGTITISGMAIYRK